MAKSKIMIVEDEYIILADLRERVEDLGYQVCCQAASGEEAVRLAKQEKPDSILMDVALCGRIDGIEAAILIRANLDIPIIFLTAYMDEKNLKRAKAVKPSGLLFKNCLDGELKTALESACSGTGVIDHPLKI